jgi:hypothetical protein
MANIVVNRVSTLGYNLTSSVEYTGQAFKPSAGFRPDSSYVSATLTNGYIWKWTESEKKNLYWITQQTDYKYRIINNTHESFVTEVEAGSSYKSGASLVIAPFIGREYLPYDWNFVNDVVLPSGYYPYAGVRARFDSKQTRPLYYAITTRYMGFYSGKRFNSIVTGYYAINKNFRLNYNWEFNAFHFPLALSASGTPDFESNLVSFGIAYTQSIFFAAKALIQYDDVSKTLGGNFRLRLNPKEGTDLFIVYNPRLHTAFPNYEKPLIDQQTLIVKFTKAFNL